MFASPIEILILNLRQELGKNSLCYMTRAEAYEELKKETGEDFGFDADKWTEWGRSHGKLYPRAGDERLGR
jgi:hypothetical protein